MDPRVKPEDDDLNDCFLFVISAQAGIHVFRRDWIPNYNLGNDSCYFRVNEIRKMGGVDVNR